MQDTRSNFQQYATETVEALTQLRQTLRALLERLLPSGYGARSLGRALGLEQTTAWRCWRIAHVADPALALQAMPGRVAWERVFKRFSEKGIGAQDIATLRESFGRIELLVFGRRKERLALMSLAAGALDTADDQAVMREVRRAVSRGNARLFGVQSKLVVSSWFIAPGPERGLVSLGVAGVIDGIGRLRPGPAWPILQRSVASAEEGKRVRYYEALGDDPSIPAMIRSASTAGIAGAEVRPTRRHGRQTLELADVSPGRNGRIRLAHAEVLRRAGTMAPDEVLPVELGATILFPIEKLVFDLFVHRDMVRITEPLAFLLGTPVGVECMQSFADANRIPMEVSMRRVRAIRLGTRCSEVGAAHLEAVQRVAEAQHSAIDAYEIHRIVLSHPPLFSTMMGRIELRGRSHKQVS